MNESEFDQWYKNHASHFPAIDAWLGKLSSADEVMGVWRATLTRLDVSDATDATTELYNRQQPLRDFGRHAVVVAGLARDIEMARRADDQRQHYADGEQVYQCLKCLDEGRITCWHPKAMAAAKAGTLGERFTECYCAVACTCSAGDQFADRQGMMRFDSERMLPWRLTSTREEAMDDLRSFMDDMARRRNEAQQWKPDPT
jgi:hypothetical protein